MRVFEEIEDEFDRIKDRWLQNLGLFVMSHPLYTVEDFWGFFDYLIDNKVFFFIGWHPLVLMQYYTMSYFLYQTNEYYLEKKIEYAWESSIKELSPHPKNFVRI